MSEQVVDRDGQEVVGRHQAGRGRHDAVPVVVGVAGKGDVVLVLEPDQPPHGVRRGRIHADAAVPVERHEAEPRVDLFADHGEIDAVALGDARPVVHAGAAQRVDAHADAGGADRVEVDHVAEVGDVASEEVVFVHAGGAPSLGDRQAPDVAEAVRQQGIGLLLDPAGDVGVGRTTVGRIVLEAAIFGRIVRRRDDDAIGEPVPAAAIVHQDGLRHRGCRRVLAALRDHRLDAVGCEHFEGAVEGGLRQGVGVDADEQGAGDPLLAAVEADRLRDRQDMRLVEAAGE